MYAPARRGSLELGTAVESFVGDLGAANAGRARIRTATVTNARVGRRMGVGLLLGIRRTIQQPTGLPVRRVREVCRPDDPLLTEGRLRYDPSVTGRSA